MANDNDTAPGPDGANAIASLLRDVDFGVAPDDYVLYELGSLVDEDRASFEDESFRRVIDEGIREHVEQDTAIRGEIACRLRKALPALTKTSQTVVRRAIDTVEDMESPLHNVSVVVLAYTAYLFDRLQESADGTSALEDEAANLIERWQRGEILREQMTHLLTAIGRPATGPLADLLFDTPEDRMAAETAIDVLGRIPCASSARVLAHAILEPILEEDIELKALSFVKAMWPRSQQYMLRTLATHEHEDLSFRWYQALIECDELRAVDLILDELLVHGPDPAYREDLKALLELLRRSNDPDVENKMLGVLNDAETPGETLGLLQDFLSTFQLPATAVNDAWRRSGELAELNLKYRAAARLYEQGKVEEALTALDAVLAVDSTYPFAVALKTLIRDPQVTPDN